ncbi:putative receptor-like protein kinase [Acorus gramineus]|uniref:Receptor-like protein kinase n=1 Tax=Acorus gramineus TaxID=55184 RepID=A0AAV9AXC1_ACOGR|nr:putative receptor-like protein kinase [Acorus gramineus]
MPRPLSSNPNPSHLRLLLLPLVVSASAALLLFLLLLFLRRLWSFRSRTSPLDSSPAVSALLRFSLRDLRSATNAFDPSNLIGRGGSGAVYRGILRDGKSVAVKRLDSSAQADREFQNELQILGGLPRPSSSPFVVSLLGYCVHKKKKKRFLVYEYMSNKSLQEALFGCAGGGEDDPASAASGFAHLSWERRFAILVDVARALEYLHEGCDPPVIHGDVKPSNVLLGADLRARLSDFGLSRVKSDEAVAVAVDDEDDLGPGLFSQELCADAEAVSPPPPPPPEVTDSEVDFARALRRFDDQNGDAQWGKDWWWRQDGSGELSSKDYVTEWIGSQVRPSNSPPDWDDENPIDQENPKPPITPANNVEAAAAASSNKKHKKMKEWWKEEYFAEMSKKCDFDPPPRIKKTGFSFRKKKRSRSIGSDAWSGGDMFSRELSSTLSMRGTVCYVAPESGGGCGRLMEKADVYSLGVLMLVTVSGRRPLHVMASPMRLERANLIGWCRQLAQAGGNVLEIVDERLKGCFDRDQAGACIHVALLCLQRVPELRPDAGEVVRILKGEMEMPGMPVELSPSPSSRVFRSSRRKGSEGARD